MQPGIADNMRIAAANVHKIGTYRILDDFAAGRFGYEHGDLSIAGTFEFTGNLAANWACAGACSRDRNAECIYSSVSNIERRYVSTEFAQV